MYALLWESDLAEKPTLVELPGVGYAMLLDGELLALDRDFVPTPRQPELPDGWLISDVGAERQSALFAGDGEMADNREGYLLVCRTGEEATGLAFYRPDHSPALLLEPGESVSGYHNWQMHGDWLLMDAGQTLYRVSLETGGVDRVTCEYVQLEADWAVTVARQDPAEPYYSSVGDADREEAARVALWLEGELSATVEAPELEYELSGDGHSDNLVQSLEYLPERGEILLYQPATYTRVYLDGRQAEQWLDLSAYTPTSVSPNGRYEAYDIATSFHGYRNTPRAVFLKDTATGDIRKLYGWVYAYRAEPLALTDSLLYNCFTNTFYSLSTGERLDFALQIPDDAPGDYGFGDDVFGHFILTMVEVPALDAYLCARPVEFSGSENPLELELYSRRDGRLLWRWEPGMYCYTYWAGAWGEWQPRAPRIELLGGSVVLVGDAGRPVALYDEDDGYQGARYDPRVVMIDLGALTYHRLPGSHWDADGSTVITAAFSALEDGEEQVTLYHYENGALVETLYGRGRFERGFPLAVNGGADPGQRYVAYSRARGLVTVGDADGEAVCSFTLSG